MTKPVSCSAPRAFTSRALLLLAGLLAIAGLARCGNPGSDDPERRVPLPSVETTAPFNVSAIIGQVRRAFRPVHNGHVAELDTHRVEVTDGRIELTPHASASASAGETLRLEPGSVTREGFAVTFDRDVALGSKGELRWGEAALSHRLRNVRDGVEQTWHFGERPGGTGDLVVRVPVQGMPLRETTSTGLHFGGETGVRYGHATWLDATGTKTAVPAALLGREVVMQVRAGTLESSEFPAELEVVISPELGTDEPVVTPSLGKRLGGIASNGTDYLVVFWSVPHIYATRVSAAGEILDPLGITVATGTVTRILPSVAWTGSDYLVVWEQHDSTPGQSNRNVYGARVSSAGEVLDEGGFGIALDSLDQHSPKVVGGDGVALVVWIDGPVTGGGLGGRRVSASGEVLDAAPISLAGDVADTTSFDLAQSDTQFLVAWERAVSPPGHPAIDARTVGEDGTLGAAFTVRSGAAAQPAVGSDGSQFLVAWQDRSAPIQTKIHATRVSPEGTVLDGDGFAVWPAQNGQLYPKVAFAAGHFFVTWNVDDEYLDGRDFGEDEFWVDLGADHVYAVRVTPAGSTSGEAQAVAAAEHQESHPHITSSGGQVLVAWEADLGGQVHGARLNCCGNVLDPNGLVLVTGQNAQRGPSIAFNGEVYLAVWSDYRGHTPAPAFELRGVRFSQSGQALDPNGIQISDANFGSGQRVAALGSTFVVVWEQPDPVPGEINWTHVRAARVMDDGSVIDSGILVGPEDVPQRRPALASAGDRVLVVWESHSGGSQIDVAGAFVTATSVGSPFPIVSSLTIQRTPAVASDGSDFLVVWAEDETTVSDGQIRATRVTSTGEALDGDGLVVKGNPFPIDTFDPVVAWGGGTYLVAWTENISSISAARVSSEGQLLDPNGFSIVASPEYGRLQQVAWLESRFLMVWDGAGVQGATITPGGMVAEGPLSIDSAGSLGLSLAAGNGDRALVIYEDLEQLTPRVWGRFVELTAPPPDGGMGGAGNTGGTPGTGATAGAGVGGAVGGSAGMAGAGAAGEAGGPGAGDDAGAGGDAGAGDDPDAGDDAGDGGEAGAGDDPGVGGDSGTAGDAGEAGTKGDGSGDEDDVGCTCRVPAGGGEGGPANLLAALAVVALAALRRRPVRARRS